MARLKIYSYPDQVLTQKALPVARVEERHRTLARDMLETMYDAPGIGLAANQVGVLERIIVVDVDFDCEDFEEGVAIPEGAEVFGGTIVMDRNSRVFINPEITKKNGKKSTKEGCLSVPEYTAEVERAASIELSYLDLDGKPGTIEATGLLAICIQHEIDHLEANCSSIA